MRRRLFPFVLSSRVAKLPLTFFVCLLSAIIGHRCQAAQQLLAMSGDGQPGTAGPVLLGISAATLNNSGQVVFRATLADGVGGISSANDSALWRVDGVSRELIAWKGAGDLPGGASHASFTAHSIADDGDVVFSAATDDGKQGLWRRLTIGTATTIALTSTGVVPDLGSAKFDSFGFQLMHASQDAVAYNAKLKAGVGGVSTANDRGIWRNLGGSADLLVREGISDVPDVVGARFIVPSAEGVNDSGQTAAIGDLANGVGGVTAPDSFGVWRLDSGGGALIARGNSGGVTGVDGASYAALSDPRINSAGQIAFVGKLAIGGDVTGDNNRGLWVHNGVSGFLAARTGVGAVPDAPGANFETLDAALLNNAGQLLFSGTLKQGVGSVTAATSKGVWVADSDGGALVARSGSGGVPGVPAANFSEFTGLAFNGDGVAAMSATLAIGSGGVTAGHEQGIWLMDAAGDGRLVARTGDQLNGRTIAALEFVGGSGGGDGRQRSLNEHGQLVYKATFVGGDEGAYLYTPDLKWRGGANGAWDEAGNWTLGIDPKSVHEVEISPSAATTVSGPTAGAVVKKLTLGDGSGETTLELASGVSLTVLDGLRLAANGRLSGRGTLIGAVVNEGAAEPGSSTGILAIEGDYAQQSTGRLSVELGGTDNSSPANPEFDQLLIFGHAHLEGLVHVSLVGGFVPAIGDSFEILHATGGLANAAAFELPALPGDRTWATSANANALSLSVVPSTPASPADFDHDGDVDGGDLQQWRNGFGASATADADGDNDVDGHDFLIWQREFTGSGGSATLVPEPTTAALIALALLVGVVRRRDIGRDST